jgi:SAM-dependent methyltransferase
VEDSPAVAQGRAIYEQFQADHLAATPLSAASSWVATGAPPPAETLRAAGFTTDEATSDELRWARKAFIRGWGYAIPCAEAVAALRGLGPFVEVGCGTGYWTALLGAAGLDVIATDASIGRSSHGFDVARYVPAEHLTAAEAVLKYRERNLFCSWPTAGEPWAAEAVSLVRPGRIVALVLDARPGVTGDAGLAEVLATACELIETVVIPQFPRVEDRLLVYRRR